MFMNTLKSVYLAYVSGTVLNVRNTKMEKEIIAVIASSPFASSSSW